MSDHDDRLRLTLSRIDDRISSSLLRRATAPGSTAGALNQEEIKEFCREAVATCATEILVFLVNEVKLAEDRLRWQQALNPPTGGARSLPKLERWDLLRLKPTYEGSSVGVHYGDQRIGILAYWELGYGFVDRRTPKGLPSSLWSLLMEFSKAKGEGVDVRTVARRSLLAKLRKTLTNVFQLHDAPPIITNNGVAVPAFTIDPPPKFRDFAPTPPTPKAPAFGSDQEFDTYFSRAMDDCLPGRPNRPKGAKPDS